MTNYTKHENSVKKIPIGVAELTVAVEPSSSRIDRVRERVKLFLISPKVLESRGLSARGGQCVVRGGRSPP